MKSNLTDDQLVRAFCSGDNNAFNVISERYCSILKASAFNVVKCRRLAEDVAQDTLVAIFLALKNGSYEESGKFIGWILRTNYRRAINMRREMHEQGLNVEDLEKDSWMHPALWSDTDPELQLQEKQREEHVAACIRKLDPVFRDSLSLRVYKGMRDKEIAEAMGVNVNTVKTRIRLGIIKMTPYVQRAYF
ncbi:MAG: RNA polymerase sigma factor [Patescibacteria group bacterium]